MSQIMKSLSFPALDADTLPVTRDALHAYARILGGWTSTCRARRKHWWHSSLRPSLNGLTTGVIFVEKTRFEIELSLRESLLIVRTGDGESLSIELRGQAANEPSDQVGRFLQSAGVSKETALAVSDRHSDSITAKFRGYSPATASTMAGALSSVTSVLDSFRAGIREETSPIQLWPHHFDLSMIWLPGDKIAGEDPDDEENADKQMGFGFVFGDGGIPEPYFYITAYPTHDAFGSLELPEGAVWKSDGFTGAVVTYRTLLDQSDPGAYLMKLCEQLLAAGKLHLINNTK